MRRRDASERKLLGPRTTTEARRHRRVPYRLPRAERGMIDARRRHWLIYASLSSLGRKQRVDGRPERGWVDGGKSIEVGFDSRELIADLRRGDEVVGDHRFNVC